MTLILVTIPAISVVTCLSTDSNSISGIWSSGISSVNATGVSTKTFIITFLCTSGTSSGFLSGARLTVTAADGAASAAGTTGAGLPVLVGGI